MTDIKIDAKALQDAMEEMRDKKFQEEMREWLAFSAPKEVIEIWKSYTERVEQRAKEEAARRQMWMSKHDEAMNLFKIVVFAFLIGLSIYCFFDIYESINHQPTKECRK